MSIVLLETTYTRKTRQRTRELITVQNTKVSHSPGQISVVDILVSKDLAVARTIHGFQAKLLLLNLKQEHAVSIMLPMSRRLPQIRLVHVGRDDFFEATLSVLGFLQVQKRIVNTSSVRQEETASR